MKNTLKNAAQSLLTKLGLYHRLKASVVYTAYWRLFDSRIVRQRYKDLAFYRESLKDMSAGDLIFDIGANQGFKTDLFLALGARVIAVEPDASNQEILRQKYHTFHIRKRPVTIVGKALSDRVGVETFWVNQPGSALNTLNVKWVEALNADANRFGERRGFSEKKEVATTTLEHLIREHGVPYFIKIDVEGYEATVLRGLMSPIPYLSFEVNLPDFRPEALECVSMLERIDPQADWSFADCAGVEGLKPWMNKADLLNEIEQCDQPSIEVYWRSSAGKKRLPRPKCP